MLEKTPATKFQHKYQVCPLLYRTDDILPIIPDIVPDAPLSAFL